MNNIIIISVILPTLNESQNIIPLIKELETQLSSLKNKKFEIIVVDDDSKDLTWKIVEDYSHSLEENRPWIKVIRRISKRGLTSALNDGITSATGDIVVWMDCDLSHPPKIVNQLVRGITDNNNNNNNNNKDVTAVVASRYVSGGSDARKGKYFFQKILSFTLYTLSKWFLKTPVRDITSGYLAIKKSALLEIGLLEGDYGEYFIDMLCKLAKKNHNIIELPYTFKNRELGESKTATNFGGYFFRGRKYLKVIFKHALRT
ncbi:MAG: glycosyltransferase [Oligoflexia bacterium]|nr:glycosyltransferase [Oligoflexia bacterium]